MSQPTKWSKRTFWVLLHRFWSNTIIKQLKQEHYLILPKDRLDNLLTTHPILTGSEVPIEPYPIWQFGCNSDPDHVFGNGLVPTRTRTWTGSPEPLLTLERTVECSQKWASKGSSSKVAARIISIHLKLFRGSALMCRHVVTARLNQLVQEVQLILYFSIRIWWSMWVVTVSKYGEPDLHIDTIVRTVRPKSVGC